MVGAIHRRLPAASFSAYYPLLFISNAAILFTSCSLLFRFSEAQQPFSLERDGNMFFPYAILIYASLLFYLLCYFINLVSWYRSWKAANSIKPTGESDPVRQEKKGIRSPFYRVQRQRRDERNVDGEGQ